MVYAPEVKVIDSVTIVDETNRDIGVTNSGEPHYQMYFDRFLFQSDSAYAVVWASDEVKSGYDPRMTVEDAKISYFLKNLYGEFKIELVFNSD